MADRDPPAVRTAGQVSVSLDVDPHAAVIKVGRVEQVHPLDTEQFIGPRTTNH